MSHQIQPGVATGKEVQEIFKLAKEKGFALPAVNVIDPTLSMEFLKPLHHSMLLLSFSFQTEEHNSTLGKDSLTKGNSLQSLEQSLELNTYTKWLSHTGCL